jgi:uncharacterized linocin/CFP29 family protein
MDDQHGQLGWSEAQWNRVEQAVADEAARGRVAGSFLPIYGPLPSSTQVVPSERMNATTWDVNDISTAPLIELSCDLTLSRQQAQEEGLPSALLLFRRAASVLARLEDWAIFNGKPRLFNNRERRPRRLPPHFRTDGGELASWSESQLVRDDEGALNIPVEDQAEKVGDQDDSMDADPDDETKRERKRGEQPTYTPDLEERMRVRLIATNPGALGLLEGGSISIPGSPASPELRQAPPLGPHELIGAIVAAIAELESQGHSAPFVCVLSNAAFEIANTPDEGSLVLPRDRIEPFLGRELLRSSAIDDRPWAHPTRVNSASSTQVREDSSLLQGVVLSLAGDTMDLAVAVEPTPEFLFIDGRGRYTLRVYERFALRIKQRSAIVTLGFGPRSHRPGARQYSPAPAEP